MRKIAGRLKFFESAWKRVTSDPVILSYITGYKIPLKFELTQKFIPDEPKLSKCELTYCRTEVQKLIEKGAITACSPHPNQFVSSYFLRDKSDGSKRFIHNLKNFNKFIKNTHFKMEDKKTVRFLLEENDFSATIDLKDAFFLVPVHKKSRKYLRFSFEGILYEFHCLPFGYKLSPYIFTKILKPVSEFLRSKGIRCVFYIDDILIMGRTEEECAKNVSIATKLLKFLGFILNLEKCQLQPSRKFKYLGFLYDSVKLTISLTEKKKEYILNLCKKYIEKTRSNIRKWAKFVGILVAASPAIKYSTLYIKSLERCKYIGLLHSHADYDAHLTLTQEAHEDIRWWINNVPIATNSLKFEKYVLEIFTDASMSGWGVCCGVKKSHGWWNDEERREHINYLELKAVYHALLCFADNYRSSHILLRVDNTTAISYINKMGSVQFPKLSELAKTIWQWCEERDLYLFASYIKSSDNVVADKESRVISEETEWEIANYAFEKITDCFGPFDIDLFASRNNAKCEKIHL